MNNKDSKIYTNKIQNLKNNVQKEFICRADNVREEKINKAVSKAELIRKLNFIFSRPNYIYQTDINIMYKNGKNITEKVIGLKDNYLMTFEGKRIYLDEIIDIK
jgi:hypothetical protein